MRLLLLFFVCCSLPVHAQTFDLVVKNARIVDGTGNGWYYGDIGIASGKIVRIGKVSSEGARRLIDAKGLVVAPGFVDVHTHIERNDLEVPTADNFIFNGVTTVITGNCGGSETDLARYFYQLDSAGPSVNVATLIGHNSVRSAVMGGSRRDPTGEEQKAMEELVEQAMRQGAVGLSTGLIYTPGTYSKTQEIVGLAKAAARYNGVYASHIRDEGDHVTAAIEEAIDIGRKAGIPVELSHFKVTYKPNWGRSAQTVEQVARARREGVDVTIDQYPYVASSTSLNTQLPSWAFSGGDDSLKARLADPIVRARIRKEMTDNLKKKQLKSYSYAVVARFSADTTANGKNISEINVLRGRKPKAQKEAETILEMVEEGGAQMVYFSMNEDDLRRIMQYPFNMFASDAGIARWNVDTPHPRTYGTNARVLGHYVRSLKILSLEEAVRRMTSLPAQRFQLRDRGLIREGMAADLVVFNEQTVGDNSTFEKPHAYSSGFEYIIVNGAVTMEKGSHTGSRNGDILRGPGWVQAH